MTTTTVQTPTVVETKEVVRAAIIREDGKVLMVRRAASDVFGGRWEFPGGKTDGQDFHDALARELFEEAGLRLVSCDEMAHERTYKGNPERHYRERTFIVTATGQVRLSDEHDDSEWCDPDYPPQPISASALTVLEGIYSRQRCRRAAGL